MIGNRQIYNSKFPCLKFTRLEFVLLALANLAVVGCAPKDTHESTLNTIRLAKPETLPILANAIPDAETVLEPSEALTLRQEAQQLAEELVARIPNNPDALEVKARFHLLFGESESAKLCWLEAIQLVPHYAYALQGLGKVSMLHSDYEQATVFFNKSIQSQPANVEAVHDLADAYTKLGAIDKAISTLEDIADKGPASALTLVLLGQGYLVKSRYEQAETVFRKAIQLSPGTTRAEQGLATVLLRTGRQDEARQLLASQQAVRASANKIRTEQEHFDEEKKECSPRFRMAAEVYLGIGDMDRAERIGIRSLALDPTSPEARVLLFSLYQKQGKIAEAIDLAREARSLNPNNPDWHFTLGVLLAQKDDFLAADSSFREVIGLAPKSPVGYQALARLLMRFAKNMSESIPIAEKLVEIRGTAADHELLAQAYAINAEFTHAFQSLSEAIRLDPANKDYAEAMMHLRRAMGTSNEKGKE
ncbi:MAG: tetratricopeptide repeat protein [Planctomycetota bacterium]|nr:tetratricopeptide repeat protein [Planctomycetota bacterium]